METGVEDESFLGALTRWMAACVVLAWLPACASVPVPADIVISNVTVHSGLPELPFLATVAVRDGIFVAVDRDGTARFDAQSTIEGDGLHLMPGLWDVHVHVANDRAGGIDVEMFTEHGVTSVRDAGGFPDDIESIRAAIASGERNGPLIYSVGPTLNGESFAPFQRALTTAEEVDAAMAGLAAAGVDMIKVHRAFDPDLLDELIDAAHAHGLDVTGHIPLGISPLDACELGMDGIEHVGSIIEAQVSVAPKEQAGSAAAIAYILAAESQPLYHCLARHQVYVAPTLVVYPAVARSRTGGGPMPAEYSAFIQSMQQIVLRLHEAGVPLLSGTDTADGGPLGIEPGSSLLDELEMLDDAGIPAADVLVIATSNAARALGVESRSGSIAVGKAADFLLLEADPAAAATNVRAIIAVFKAGKRVSSGKPLHKSGRAWPDLFNVHPQGDISSLGHGMPALAHALMEQNPSWTPGTRERELR